MIDYLIIFTLFYHLFIKILMIEVNFS